MVVRLTSVYIFCERVDNFLLAWYACISLDILSNTYPRPINQSHSPPKQVSRVIDHRPCEDFRVSCQPAEEEVVKIKEQLLQEYSDVFTQEGKLRKIIGRPMKISLQEDAQPSSLSAPRQIPYAYRQLVKDKLDKQVAAGVIQPVTEATDWVHPLVVVPKPKGGVRLRVDLQKLNKYVKRPYYPTRTPSDAVANIAPDSHFFTTVDAVKGYWQVPLDEESQILTTFITPYGRFKF